MTRPAGNAAARRLPAEEQRTTESRTPGFNKIRGFLIRGLPQAFAWPFRQ
jgi:hypothetical protein